MSGLKAPVAAVLMEFDGDLRCDELLSSRRIFLQLFFG